MKKSDLYHMAQIAVVNSPSISPEGKLEVLRALFAQEEIELYIEERDVIGQVNAELEGELT